MRVRLAAFIGSLGLVGTGINHAIRCVVRTDDGEQCVAYVKRLPTREIVVEVACALLAAALKLPVPDPLLVRMPDVTAPIQFGSASIDAPPFQYELNRDSAVALAKIREWKGLLSAGAFDDWIANADRHPNNILHDGRSGFWLIDHGLAMPHGCAPGVLCNNQLLDQVALKDRPAHEIDSAVRPALLKIAQDNSQTSLEGIETAAEGVFAAECREVLDFLQHRQSNLRDLVLQRLPLRQGDMLDVRPA